MIEPSQPVGYSLIFVEIIAVKPAQNQDYRANQNAHQKPIQTQLSAIIRKKRPPAAKLLTD
jgi:hypothetical protein